MNYNRGTGVSLTTKLKKVSKDLEKIRTEFLFNLAEQIVDDSPVDTGTYIVSHNVGEKSAAGKFTGPSKYIGPAGQDKIKFKGIALEKLKAQIAALPKEQVKVNISNNSGHASAVEYGSPTWKKTRPYLVYYKASKNASRLFKEAVAKVRGIE